MIYKDPVLLVLIDIMSFWYLVERPDGFFLECSSSFTYPDVLPHVKAVDKELMVEMLTKGYITYITHLSIDEFEVQRALGTCLSGPIKICVQPKYRDRILQLMAL